jgi:isoquinoline 1-oxidoreductase subunit beta
MTELHHTRRAFLKGTGGLIVAAYLPSCGHTQRGAPDDFVANAFVRITPDNRVIFTLARVEMGQGTMTSETMLVAEELGLELKEIEVEHAPNHADYRNPQFLVQSTGGSTSTTTSFEPLRQAGAMAREALLGAAAAEWGVPKNELVLEHKLVRHAKTKREAKMGDFAVRARDFVDSDAKPKPREEWKLIGTSQARIDAKAKVDGTAVFGADPDPPNLEVAVVIHGPYGSTLVSYDADAAQKMPGVKAIFPISTGVAVVADRYPRARKAASAVKVEWSKSDFSTKQMFAEYGALLDKNPGDEARDDGDADEIIEKSANAISAEYRFPYVAHAAMEPMTTTVWVDGDRCEIWAPTQATMLNATIASEVTGISKDKITVHQTLLGGGFGRKGYGDVVQQAAEIAKQRPGPVRLMYSREDDIQRDLFRPASLHRVRAVVDKGKPIAWTHSLVTQSSLFTELMKPLLKEAVPGFMAGAALWGARTFAPDPSILEGATTLPYAIENVKVCYHRSETVVPTGVWRAVGHTFNGFVSETFIDELAVLAKKDPYEFRRDLLQAHPRHLAVLETAAKKGDWGKPLANGRARGIAVHESFHSYASVVVEASLDGKLPRVDRVVVAVDCGVVINPDGVRAQVESGVIYGLASALTQQAITLVDGRVEQSNFHDFELLRMHQCPKIEVHLVKSDAAPTGIGEVAVAPTPPAVANAFFQLTGKRIRELPIRLEA